MKHIRNLFNRFFSKSKPTPGKHPVLGIDIEIAFTIGERNFYRFKDMNKMPARRWSEFLLKFDEMRMGITREWLEEQFIKPVKESLIVTDKLDLTLLSSKVNELNNRLKLSCNEDSVFAVASVVFFELTENLTVYDFQVGRANIAFWKANQQPEHFFLNEPIGSLTGFSNHSSEAIQTYLREMKIMTALIEAQSFNTYRTN